MELITEYLQQIIIGILLIAFGVFLTKPLRIPQLKMHV